MSRPTASPQHNAKLAGGQRRRRVLNALGFQTGLGCGPIENASRRGSSAVDDVVSAASAKLLSDGALVHESCT
jgi:hypothetical protein